MHKPKFTVGLNGEFINWNLQSSSCVDGTTQNVFVAKSKNYNRTYHLKTISSDSGDAQHLSIL